MKAGSNLDVLIYTRVMGNPEKWAVFFGGSVYGHGLDKGKAQEMLEHVQGDFKGQIRNDYQVPYYSTSIADAWQVVEKMDGDGFCTEIDKREAGWAVAFIDYRKPLMERITHNYVSISDTAPHAICLAALKAVGWNE